MEEIWKDLNPAKQFLERLRYQKATELLQNNDLLRHCRYNHEFYTSNIKVFGDVYKHLNIDFFQKVLEASEPRPTAQPTEEKTQPPERIERANLPHVGPLRELPSVLMDIIAQFVGATKPKPVLPMPEVPEYNSAGHYGHYGDMEPSLPGVKII